MKYITQKQLSEKLEPINLQALIAQETNGRMRIRLLALSHIKDGALLCGAIIRRLCHFLYSGD